MSSHRIFIEENLLHLATARNKLLDYCSHGLPRLMARVPICCVTLGLPIVHPKVQGCDFYSLYFLWVSSESSMVQITVSHARPVSD